jgi:hypothetical protein
MSNETTWERTSVQYLLRNRASGRYYGRWTIGGKQKWVNLNTDVFAVAKLRLSEEASKVQKSRSRKESIETGAGTVGDLLKNYEDRTRRLHGLKPSSITARITAPSPRRVQGVAPPGATPFPCTG